MQINCRLPLSVLSVWQCPEATRKRPVCLGINEYERKYKKYFKKKRRRLDFAKRLSFPLSFSLSMVWTVGVLRALFVHLHFSASRSRFLLFLDIQHSVSASSIPICLRITGPSEE